MQCPVTFLSSHPWTTFFPSFLPPSHNSNLRTQKTEREEEEEKEEKEEEEEDRRGEREKEGFSSLVPLPPPLLIFSSLRERESERVSREREYSRGQGRAGKLRSFQRCSNTQKMVLKTNCCCILHSRNLQTAAATTTPSSTLSVLDPIFAPSLFKAGEFVCLLSAVSLSLSLSLSLSSSHTHHTQARPLPCTLRERERKVGLLALCSSLTMRKAAPPHTSAFLCLFPLGLLPSIGCRKGKKEEEGCRIKGEGMRRRKEGRKKERRGRALSLAFRTSPHEFSLTETLWNERREDRGKFLF